MANMLKSGTPSRGRKSRTTVPATSAAINTPRQRAPLVLKPFPIVGSGASAGGLEALDKFPDQVPPDGGSAFVVVTQQHTGLTRLLPELLGKCTRMRVKLAADGMAVEPHAVYLSLPAGCLAILPGTLHLMVPDETGMTMAIPADVNSFRHRAHKFCLRTNEFGGDENKRRAGSNLMSPDQKGWESLTLDQADILCQVILGGNQAKG